MVRSGRSQNPLILSVTMFRNPVIELTVWTMIDKSSNRNLSSQLWNSANVIVVVMRNEEVVDFLESGLLRRGDNLFASRRSLRGQPASISSDSPDGETNKVA